MKHTSGPMHVVPGVTPVFIENHEHTIIAKITNLTLPIEEIKANGALICEAFNVSTETGCSPSELLRQRDELKQALKLAFDTLKPAIGDLFFEWPEYEAICNALDNCTNKV